MSDLPHLILLNGAPGVGKSTLAARWVADRPLALNLDVDVVRSLLGGWTSTPGEAGNAARRLALAMAASHLREGLHVVVPQYVAVAWFVDALAGLAQGRASFHHVVLRADPGVTWRRLTARHDPDGIRAPLDERTFGEYVERLDAFTAGRAEAVPVETDGDLGAASGRLEALLGRVVTRPAGS